jgi:subtilisin
MRASRASRTTATGVSLLFLLTLVAGPSTVGAQQPSATTSWIVTLAPGVEAPEKAPGLAQAAGGRIGLVYTHALNGFQLLGSAAAADALRRNPSVQSVTPDYTVALTETLPYGVKRVDAFVSGAPGGAYQAGYRGNGARIAIIDTGIDLDHPDLASAIDVAGGKNCVNELLPPDDGYGHGTHVAGTAAAPLNGTGVVGVAAEATLLPVKVFDDSGNSSESLVLCGLNHVIGLNSDGDPANDVDVASMSFGESRPWGACGTDALHTAICNAAATGMVLVGGAGNSSADAGTFVPAAFPEVISVSGLADFDGQPGGLAGCGYVADLFWFECDDTFAFFSNRGSSVDVIAPGVQVYSTWKDGGYNTISGTSMATPHVSGVAALMKAANPALTGADVLTLLQQTGECPNGAWSDADGVAGCAGQGQWPDDPDGSAEPLVNALRAAQSAGNPPPPGPPSAPVLTATAGDGTVNLSWTAPSNGGSQITNYIVYRGTEADGATELTTLGPVQVFSDSGLTNGTSYVYQVAAVNAIGSGPRSNEVSATPIPTPIPTPTPSPSPTPSPTPPPAWQQAPQGDWVGSYGADGYALLGWNATSDLVVLPSASLTLDQGARYRWNAGTTDLRAVESPDQSTRRAAQWFHLSSLRLHLTFNTAYSGTLHLYALDWDSNSRRENVIVDDGSGPQTISLASTFNGGAWLHFPISVAAGGTVTIRANTLAGRNATLSGLFLGGP